MILSIPAGPSVELRNPGEVYLLNASCSAVLTRRAGC